MKEALLISTDAVGEKSSVRPGAEIKFPCLIDFMQTKKIKHGCPWPNQTEALMPKNDPRFVVAAEEKHVPVTNELDVSEKQCIGKGRKNQFESRR